MRDVIGGVAAVDVKVQWHAAVIGQGQGEQQLLEVGAIVLAATPVDGRLQSSLPEDRLLRGDILAVKHSRTVHDNILAG